MSGEDWRSPTYRQSVVAKIDEAIKQSGNPTTKNAMEMEAHFFQKAKNREDYLGFLARLLLHVHEMQTKQKGGAPNQGGNTGAPTGPTSQDPINALQNLARQSSGVNAGPHPGPPGNVPAQGVQQNQMFMQNMQNMQNPMNNSNQGHAQMNNQPMGNPRLVNPNFQQTNVNPNFNQNFNNDGNMTNYNQPNAMMPNINNPNQQMQQNNPASALLNQLNHTNAANNPMNALMVQRQRLKLQQQQQQQQQNIMNQPGGITPQQQQQQQQQQLLQQQMLQQRKTEMQGVPNMQQYSAGPMPRQGTPTQFISQSPNPGMMASQPSPASMGQVMSSGLASQMVASPAYANSPGSGIAPSPAGAGGRVMGVGPGQAPRNLTISTPGSMLNTPGHPGSVPSPRGGAIPMTEDQAYLEKVRQLSRFIDPLTRMIAKLGDDDTEKLAKMKKLLEILANPSKKVPMETLLKCEVVLEKMDLKKDPASVGPASQSSIPSLAVPVSTSRETATTPLHSLLETIASQAKSPVINHTLRRTFGPVMETLLSCDILPFSPPKKRKVEETEDSLALDLIKKEAANLDQRFEITLDALQPPGGESVTLVCRLNDTLLPSVPPLTVEISKDYPRVAPSPKFEGATQDTGFGRSIRDALLSRMTYLPGRYSLSQLLLVWEMSVRQNCQRDRKDPPTAMSALTVAMGV